MVDDGFLVFLVIAGVVLLFLYGGPVASRAQWRWDVMEAKARKARKPQEAQKPPEAQEGVSRWDLLKDD